MDQSNNKYLTHPDDAKKMGSNGLTREQLQAVNDAQARGQAFEQMDGNLNVLIPAWVQNKELEGEAKNEMVKFHFNEHQKFFFWVWLRIPSFDPVTGKDKSTSQVVPVNPPQYAANVRTKAWAGYNVTVLHDPTRMPALKGEDGKFSGTSKAKIL